MGFVEQFYWSIVIVFAIIFIYWLRANVNITSTRRLEYLVKERFKAFRDGSAELQKYDSNDIIVKHVNIIRIDREHIMANITYKTKDSEYTTKSYTYKLSKLCGMVDPFCINIA